MKRNAYRWLILMHVFAIFWQLMITQGFSQAPAYYLPPGASFVRGVISVENSALTQPTWQSFAERNSVLLAVAGTNPQGSLASLATATGRAEVNVAPYVPYGLSSGGRNAMQTAVANPTRCLAVIPHHPGRMFMTGNDGFNFNRLDGTVAASTLFSFTPAFPVPAIFLAGERDNLSGFVMPTENFEIGRRSGDAPWCLITEPNVQHTGTAMPAALVTLILEGMITRRLPVANWPANQAPTLRTLDVTTGWLADIVTKEIAPYSSFAGDRSRAAWLPDAASADAWAAYVIAQPFRRPNQTVALPSTVADLQIFDPATNVIHPSNQAGGTSGEAAWKVCANVKTADFCYVAAHGSAIYSVPSMVAGADWIRPREDASAFTGNTLLSFTLTKDADVYIAHDNAIVNKPSWLTGWTDTGQNLTLGTGANLFANPFAMRMFKKSFTTGQSVALGANGATSGTRMYLTLIQPTGASASNEVSVVVSDANASEAGLDAGAFTVTRGSATAGAISINFTLSGSATSGSDYAALSGSVSIPDGQSSASIAITPVQDALVEGDETVSLTLVAGAGYTIGTPSTGTITIADDDGEAKPQVSLSLSPSNTSEGTATSINVTLTRTGSVTLPLNVTLSLTGDAGMGSDYSTFSLNQTIPAGSLTHRFSTSVIDDADLESTETMTLTVISTTAYDAAPPASGTILITDNENTARTIVTGLTYATMSTGDLKLDLYLPRNVSGPTPCVISIHGGGWQNGSRSPNGEASDLNTRGIAVAAISYRLSGVAPWPAQLHDVKSSIRWLRANASAYNLDPNRFGTWGVSAGAHLSCMAATTGGSANIIVGSTHTDLEGNSGAHWDQSDAIQAAASWFAPTDLLRMDNAPGQDGHNARNSPEGNLIGAAIQTVPERSASANPLVHISSQCPPMLVMHGSTDTTVPFIQGVQLHDRLLRDGREVLFFPVVGQGHGFTSTEINDMARWFQSRFGNAPANQAPLANISTNAITGTAPLTIHMDASASTDLDGSIATYAWSFGNNEAASGVTASHTYNLPGTYRITLAVIDDDRAIANASTLITVLPQSSTNPNPVVSITSPVSGFIHLAPAAFHLQASSSASNGASIAVVEFSINDQLAGSDRTAPYGLSVGGLSAGTHVLRARAIDSNGAQVVSPPVSIIVKSRNPTPKLVEDGGQTYLTLAHHFHPMITNRVITLEGTHNLIDWQPVPPFLTTTPFGIVHQATLRDPSPISAQSSRFLRLSTKRPSP
jgi:acetyl esterase/lipase